jgi:hypothetical protein
MALLMVMPVCLLVYAALEYRFRLTRSPVGSSLTITIRTCPWGVWPMA